MTSASIFAAPERSAINIDGEKLQNGIAKLVLTLVEVLVEILERQALRRVNSGTLTKEEVERLGLAFIQIRERTGEIANEFGLKKEDLSLAAVTAQNAGQVSIVDLVDRLIDKGTVVAGEVKISVADIDLIVLNLLGMLSSVHALEQSGKK